jgi:hypothetical protein
MPRSGPVHLRGAPRLQPGKRRERFLSGRLPAGEVFMNLARYFVLSSGEEWLVTFEGAVMGRYPTRTEATEAAVVMANLMGAMRYDADVMVEAALGGRLEVIWVYGQGRLPTPKAKRKGTPEMPRRHIHLVQRGEAA